MAAVPAGTIFQRPRDLIFPVEGLVTRCLEGPEAAGNSEAPGFESNPFELKYVNRAFSGGVALLATA